MVNCVTTDVKFTSYATFAIAAYAIHMYYCLSFYHSFHFTSVFIHTKVVILILWWRTFKLEYWRTFQLVYTFISFSLLCMRMPGIPSHRLREGAVSRLCRVFRENTAAVARMIFPKTACGMTLHGQGGHGLPLSVGMELPVLFIRFIFSLLFAGFPS